MPDAFLNFLAFLGWNPGDDREIFSKEELVEAFSIERIGKSGTRFDIAKAKWFNEQYLRAESNETLASFIIEGAKADGITLDQAKAKAIASLTKERCTFPADMWSDNKFIAIAPASFDEQVASKKWNEDAVKVLSNYATCLEEYSGDFDAATAKSMLEKSAEAEEIKLGKVMQAVRLAVTGAGAGPDLMEIFAILGVAEVANRIRYALATLAVVG